MTTAAQIIAQKLHAAGCRHAFGMPGGEVLLLMQALDAVGIDFTLCKHENAAGFMAEGSYHATGAPGILLTTIGPGLVNGLNAVANAFQEQVPLIVLSGCIGPAEAESFTHQVINQSSLMAPITKAQFQVAAGSAQQVIEKAIAIARADPPGPVHVDVPHDLAGSEVAVIARELVQSERPVWSDGPSLEQARAMLASAKRPVILAGLGAVHHHAGPQILALAERFNAPVITTYKAKGIIDESHPLCLGGHGLSPRSDAVILPLLAQSDCIILAGYDPIEMRNGWIEPWDAANAIDLTHADIQHGMHGAAVRFIGDVGKALETLGSGVVPQVQDGSQVETARLALDDMFAPRTDWGPHQVFDAVQRALPKGAVATADSGAHRILLSQMWKCDNPQTLLQSTCFCTMGIALPLAIGYAKAAPDKKVVAFVGDAGLEMVMGELATLRDLGLPVVVVVLVDGALSLIDLKQARGNLPQLGVRFDATDFVGIARAYGGDASWVANRTALTQSLSRAFESDGFSLIACKIDKSHYTGAF